MHVVGDVSVRGKETRAGRWCLAEDVTTIASKELETCQASEMIERELHGEGKTAAKLERVVLQ